jgi:subtilase family serine protease
MRRRFLVVALTALAAILVTSLTYISVVKLTANSPSTAPPRHVITGHLVPRLRQAHPTRDTDGARILNLSIALTLRNTAQLKALIAAQNDPHSTLYHQFLTPDEFTQQFGPTQATVDTVSAYLRGQGLTVTSVSPNHTVIDATGSVATARKAFAVHIRDYTVDGRTVYAPTDEPSVPAALGDLITDIGGLDDVGVYQPLGERRGASALSHATGPGGGFTPSELRTAYDMLPLLSGADGAGQTIAIFELDGYQASDVNQYLSNYNLGSAKYSNVLVDGATNIAGAGAIEVELDMEVVSAIAPGATQKIYIGPNSTQGVNDTYNTIVTDNIAKVTSTSWGLCEASSGTSELAALNNIFAQGAAQGQAVFAASGDSGAYDCNDTTLAVDSPSGDPNVVGVGGTRLTVGSGGSYRGESVWSSPNDTSRSSKGAGGGGGISSYFAKPSYQSGPGVENAYSNGKRQAPDVAAAADPASGYSVYCTVAAAGCNSSGWISVGGTSAAAPLWAGIAADTNQYLIATGKPTLGSASAMLYSLFNTAQPFSAYHDVTSGDNLYYPATSGYDQASGIGTPDVWNLARDAAGVSGGGATGNGVTNGNFETGNLRGWTSAGVTAISTTAHSGSSSAQIGSTSPTNGDSSISQTFTIPSGTGTLSFWYQAHCTDTVTYDWAMAQLTDHSTGVIATVLAKTCTNNGAWVQVSVNVSANVGHSVTLALIDHDDDYAGDPTYTLFDDVAVS